MLEDVSHAPLSTGPPTYWTCSCWQVAANDASCLWFKPSIAHRLKPLCPAEPVGFEVQALLADHVRGVVVVP